MNNIFQLKYYLITICTALSLVPLTASADRITDWRTVNFSSISLAPIGNSSVIGLGKNYSPYIYNLFTGTITKTLPGKFTLIKTNRNSTIFALNRNNAIYVYEGRVWKKVKTKREVETFSLSDRALYYSSKGVWFSKSLTKNQGTETEVLPNIPDKVYVNTINPKTFIVLDKNNKLSTFQGSKEKVIFNNIKKVLFVRGDVIFFSDLKDNVYAHTTKNKSNRKIIKNLKFHSLHLTQNNKLLAATNKKVYLSEETIEQVLNINKELVYKIKRTKSTASELYSGDGLLIRKSLLGRYAIWRKEEKEFLPITGKFQSIAISSLENIWGIEKFGNLYQVVESKAIRFPNIAKFVSALEKRVMIIDQYGNLLRYDQSIKKFKKLGNKAVKVFIEGFSRYWVVTKDKKLLRCSKRCKNIKGAITKISVSPNGLVYALDVDGNLLLWEETKFKKVPISVRGIKDIAAQSANTLWILDDKHQILMVEIRNKKSLLYSVDSRTPKNSKLPKFITKLDQKKFLINNRVISNFQAKRTAAAPNIKLRSKSLKKLKLKTIINNIYMFDISMGRDGVLWALSNDKVFQYKEKDQSFKVYNRTNFRGGRQPFLGLPKDTVSSLISDSLGKIWAVKKDSKKVLYQKKVKGNFFTKNVPSPENITDITVDVAGNVYIAAGNIYLFDEQRQRFKRFISKGGPTSFDRISSGVKGSLWLTNIKGELFELEGGRLVQKNRPNIFSAQDVDMSVTGEVYVTSNTHRTVANEPGDGINATPLSGVKCELRRYNPDTGRLDETGKNSRQRAQYAAVSVDGTPWMTCAPAGSRNIFRAE